MTDILIIGSGPAGISAALYAKRAGFDVKVITAGETSLNKAHLIENYYGFKEAISGKELYENGIAQAKSLDIEIIESQVFGIGFENSLTVTTESETISAKAVILATGSARKAPNIKGLKDFEGAGVSYCAVCDGFFHKGKNVAVLGSALYTLHEALELKNIAGSVTILTNGDEPSFEVPSDINVNTKKIESFTGDKVLSSANFEDGSSSEFSGVFVAVGTAGSTDLARKLGAITEGNKIAVDEKMATNIPGLFAAGDCTPGMMQVAKAVYQGAQAATSAIAFVRGSK